MAWNTLENAPGARIKGIDFRFHFGRYLNVSDGLYMEHSTLRYKNAVYKCFMPIVKRLGAKRYSRMYFYCTDTIFLPQCMSRLLIIEQFSRGSKLSNFVRTSKMVTFKCLYIRLFTMCLNVPNAELKFLSRRKNRVSQIPKDCKLRSL